MIIFILSAFKSLVFSKLVVKKKKKLALGCKDPPLQLPLATTKTVSSLRVWKSSDSEEPSLWAEGSPVIAGYCFAQHFASLYILVS